MRKMKIDLKQINRKDLLLPVTIMAALLAAIFAVVMFLGRAERITVKEPLYQYIFSDKDAYPDGITMKKTEDAVMVDNGVQTVESSGAPYYYEGQFPVIYSFCSCLKKSDVEILLQFFNQLLHPLFSPDQKSHLRDRYMRLVPFFDR